MYFHVIENTMRDGIKGYRLVKTYKRYASLEKWLLRTGHPVWVLESNLDYLPYRSFMGGFSASYWNSGGWGLTTMPKLPMLT